MSVMSVQYSFRPLRVGWVVPHDLAAVYRAMELSFMFLGGRYNPIIPAADPSLADSLIDLFSPDVLWPVTQNDEVSRVIGQHSYLQWPSIHKELFVGNQKGSAGAQLLDVRHAMLALEPTNEEARTRLHLNSMQLEWKDDDPLAAVLMAMFGRYSDPEHGSSYRTAFSKLLGPDVVQISNTTALPAGVATTVGSPGTELEFAL